MKVLPEVSSVNSGARVVLRMDLDVAEGDNLRLLKSLPTLNLLLAKKCKIIILGHKGRPLGMEEKYSLRPVYAELMSLLEGSQLVSSVFIPDLMDLESIDSAVDNNEIVFLENVRFYSGENENSEEFLKYLASLGEVYVQEAFATAHRESPSMMIGKLLPCYFGLSFIEEYRALEKLVESPKRPLVIILGGVKEDKLSYLPNLLGLADMVLLVGRLPLFNQYQSEKLKVGKLREDGLDLSPETIVGFCEIIRGAGSVIWAGSVGKWEDGNSEIGTVTMLQSLKDSSAYKVIAGGDTGAALVKFLNKEAVDLICSGGGVLLHFLSNQELPVTDSFVVG